MVEVLQRFQDSPQFPRNLVLRCLSKLFGGEQIKNAPCVGQRPINYRVDCCPSQATFFQKRPRVVSSFFDFLHSVHISRLGVYLSLQCWLDMSIYRGHHEYELPTSCFSFTDLEAFQNQKIESRVCKEFDEGRQVTRRFERLDALDKIPPIMPVSLVLLNATSLIFYQLHLPLNFGLKLRVSH
jgi:hypothetical protein